MAFEGKETEELLLRDVRNESFRLMTGCVFVITAQKKKFSLPLIPPAGTLKKQRNYRNSDETRVVFIFKLDSFASSSF